MRTHNPEFGVRPPLPDFCKGIPQLGPAFCFPLDTHKQDHRICFRTIRQVSRHIDIDSGRNREGLCSRYAVVLHQGILAKFAQSKNRCRFPVEILFGGFPTLSHSRRRASSGLSLMSGARMVGVNEKRNFWMRGVEHSLGLKNKSRFGWGNVLTDPALNQLPCPQMAKNKIPRTMPSPDECGQLAQAGIQSQPKRLDPVMRQDILCHIDHLQMVGGKLPSQDLLHSGIHQRKRSVFCENNPLGHSDRSSSISRECIFATTDEA